VEGNNYEDNRAEELRNVLFCKLKQYACDVRKNRFRLLAKPEKI